MAEFKEKYESLIRLASDGCIIYEPSGKILEFNEGACHHLGYTAEEFSRFTLFDLFPEEDLLKRPLRLDLLSHGQSMRDVRRIRRKDGGVYLIELNSVKLSDGSIMALATDVTETAKIRKELNMKDQAVSSSISGMGIADMEGRVVYANKALYSMWGYQSEAELIGREAHTFFEGNEAPAVLETIRAKGVQYGECSGRRADGTVFPVAYSANIVTDHRNKPVYLFASFLDISEQQKTRYLSDQIIDNLPVLFFIYDIAAGKITRWNSRVEEITTFSHKEMVDIPFTALVKEEELDRMMDGIRRTIRDGKGELEIELKDKSGRYHPFYFTAFVVKLGDKDVLIANGMDITERKQAAEMLQRRFEQLQLIARLSDAVSKAGELEIIYQLALDGLRETTSADRAAVLLFDDKGVMQFKAAHGLSEAYQAKAAGHSPWQPDTQYPEPVFIPDVTTEPSLSALLPHIQQEGITALGFIPLVYMNRLLGKFMVYYNDRHAFTGEEIYLMQTIAREVAFAIGEKENELALRKSEQQYRELSAHLQDVREEERTVIAREIHDELGQQLTVLKIDFSWLASRLNLNDSPMLKEKFEDIGYLLDNAVQTVRRMSSSLRPSMLDDLGLVYTIDWYLRDFGKRMGVRTVFEYTQDDLHIPDKVRTALFRIFQESVTNIIRHSAATEVRVTLEKNESGIQLQITDNGKGFDLNAVESKRTLGLLGMKERSQLVGGHWQISSIPGAGTTISVVVNPELP